MNFCKHSWNVGLQAAGLSEAVPPTCSTSVGSLSPGDQRSISFTSISECYLFLTPWIQQRSR
ncbi:MAG: hypothetical protein KGQ60_18590, partial [Planctomycetes bacterium]|nr:hypothetical protein [Planctomycetota bacterium]